MTHLVTLVRRAARLRAPLLVAFASALGACDAADRLTNTTEETAAIPAQPAATPVSFASSSNFRGGIPIGNFNMPSSEFGSIYNGAMRNIWPKYLLKELAEIKASGGKVVLMFAGSEGVYKDSDGHFDLAKWKARVDRFKEVDFSSFVKDGTIIAHFLLDEPNDPTNWHGQPVRAHILDEMARYSKELWPNMATVVRAEPWRLANLGGSNFRYLDAAWAQYTTTKGNVNDYIRQNTTDANRMGLALVVGLNVTKGNITRSKQGVSRKPMTAEQVRTWGSVLLSSSYPCAFLSWNYDANYLRRSDIRDAMETLAQKARARSSKSCRGLNGQTKVPDSDPTEPPPPTPLPPPDPETPPPPPPQPLPSEPPAASPIQLSVTAWTAGHRQYMKLVWSGARGANIDVYHNGALKKLLKSNARNDGRYAYIRTNTKPATYVFKVCEQGASVCSNEATAVFR
jgi:hypothetical protein